MLHSVSDKPFMPKVARSAVWNFGAGLKLSLGTVPVEFLSFAQQGWVSNVNEKANDNRGVSVCGDLGVLPKQLLRWCWREDHSPPFQGGVAAPSNNAA